jgi:hypothetical protein
VWRGARRSVCATGLAGRDSRHLLNGDQRMCHYACRPGGTGVQQCRLECPVRLEAVAVIGIDEGKNRAIRLEQLRLHRHRSMHRRLCAGRAAVGEYQSACPAGRGCRRTSPYRAPGPICCRVRLAGATSPRTSPLPGWRRFWCGGPRARGARGGPDPRHPPDEFGQPVDSACRVIGQETSSDFRMLRRGPN